jgi:tetratricopeptide (TPR) repeat protein
MSMSFPVQGDDNPQALNIRGFEFLLAGEAEEALACFRQALRGLPHNPVILNNMGNALFQLKRLPEAEQAYKDAAAARNDYFRPYRNLGLLYQLQDRVDEGITAYEKYLQLVPDDGEAFYNLGLLFNKKGMVAEARASFEAASKYLAKETPH